MSTVGLPPPPRKITPAIAAEGDAIDEWMARKAKDGDKLRAAQRKVWGLQDQKEEQEVLIAELREKMIAAHQRIAEINVAQAADMVFIQTHLPLAAKKSTPIGSSGSSKGKSSAASTPSSPAWGEGEGIGATFVTSPSTKIARGGNGLFFPAISND